MVQATPGSTSAAARCRSSSACSAVRARRAAVTSRRWSSTRPSARRRASTWHWRGWPSASTTVTSSRTIVVAPRRRWGTLAPPITRASNADSSTERPISCPSGTRSRRHAAALAIRTMKSGPKTTIGSEVASKKGPSPGSTRGGLSAPLSDEEKWRAGARPMISGCDTKSCRAARRPVDLMSSLTGVAAVRTAAERGRCFHRREAGSRRGRKPQGARAGRIGPAGAARSPGHPQGFPRVPPP